MNQSTVLKHYTALIDQAISFGWSSEKAQNGTGPSLLAFWPSYIHQLNHAVDVLNQIAAAVGHPPVSTDENPVSIVTAVTRRLRYAAEREETLDHLIARVMLCNQQETASNLQLPTVWRGGLSKIMQEAQQVLTEQALLDVPAAAPICLHLTQIRDEAARLLQLLNNATTNNEFGLELIEAEDGNTTEPGHAPNPSEQVIGANL